MSWQRARDDLDETVKLVEGTGPQRAHVRVAVLPPRTCTRG
jgi:hypothetical protein